MWDPKMNLAISRGVVPPRVLYAHNDDNLILYLIPFARIFLSESS